MGFISINTIQLGSYLQYLFIFDGSPPEIAYKIEKTDERSHSGVRELFKFDYLGWILFGRITNWWVQIARKW